MQKRTVWILGAGASKAAYCGMPLTGEIMTEALHRTRSSTSRVTRFLDRLRARHGYQDLNGVNVEELLTFAACDEEYLDRQGNVILQDEVLSRRLYHDHDALASVQKLIAGVLFEAQRECLQRGDRVHDALAEKS